jgi:hypothetical protein
MKLFIGRFIVTVALVAAIVAVWLAVDSLGAEVRSAEAVSQQAESLLREQNPDITEGTMKCRELVMKLGREVRCLHSAHVGFWDVTWTGTVAVTQVEKEDWSILDVFLHDERDPPMELVLAIREDNQTTTYAADRKTNESMLAGRLKVDKEQVRCPRPIPGKVGSVGYCGLTDDDGVKHSVKLIVKSSDFAAGKINYAHEVVD